MESVLNLLLLRFAVIAAVVAVVALILFAIAVGLRRRGRWEHTRDKVVRSALPIIKDLAGSHRTGARQGGPLGGRRSSIVGTVGSAAIRYAADKAAGQRHDQQQSADSPRSTGQPGRR